VTPTLTHFLSEVAEHYDALPLSDNSTATRRCYAALCHELDAQFFVLTSFVRVRFVAINPYQTSRHMFEDIEKHRNLDVFTGGEALAPTHLFSATALSGWTYNLVFRAVHDGLAHYPGRNSFSPTGEFRAFVAHTRILSPDAVRALATETLGQNAYYNVAKRYAPQKFALLSPSVIMRALSLVGDA